MSLSYTKTSLSKIEELFKDLQYRIRYERGNFKSGYCIVNSSNIIVVNKFFDTKSRIQTLVDILSILEYDREELSDNSKVTLEKIIKSDLFVTKMVA